MKTLVLVRHGDVERSDVTLSDLELPLSARGRRETAAAVRQFISLGRGRVDAVVSSPARRALDTADIWLKSLRISAERLQVVQDIYEAERTDLLRVVQQLDDASDTVVLVGHNPGVTALLHYLAGRGVEAMTQSSFAVISIDVDSWSRLAMRHSELVHYYVPPLNAQFNSVWERFVLWKRLRPQKVALFFVFLIGLVLILGIIAAIVFMGGK